MMNDRFKTKYAVCPDGCHLWTGNKSKSGYGKFKLRDGTQARAHRVAWEITYGPIPEGLSVLHKCDVRNCVNPDHLFLGTQADNMGDMVSKGRSLIGERNGRSKLTKEEVLEIRKHSRTDAEMARLLGVSEGAVRHARIGRNWKTLGAMLSIHPVTA